MSIFLVLFFAIAGALALAYVRANGCAWLMATAAFLIAAMMMLPAPHSIVLWVVLWLFLSAAAVLLNYVPLRRQLLSDPLFTWYKKLLPAVSRTEQEALDAGTVWWNGELSTGIPNWNKLLAYPNPRSAPRNRRFSTAPPKPCARWSTIGKSPTSCTIYRRKFGATSVPKVSWP
ncbi:MAG: hypothetical protein ABIP64_04435 [Burkholderiales bacterium]